MRSTAEIFLIVVLFFACVFVFCGGSLPKIPTFEPEPVAPMMMASPKDPYDSFETVNRIGLVVRDTSSLSSTEEQPLYDALTRGGAVVVKIDTTTMDQATYNSEALNWSSLKLAILPFGTDSAAIDTSIANGIGDVPLIILEPFYWAKFGLPDSSGLISGGQDSVRMNGVAGFIDTSAIWAADDSIDFTSSQVVIHTVEPPTFDTNALVLDLAGSDTVVVFDTLNAQQPRIAWGITNPGNWNDDEKEGWSLFNRAVSRLAGTYTDSLFTIGITQTSEGIISSNEEGLKNYLEMNGHIVVIVDEDSAQNGVEPHTDWLWSELDVFVYYGGSVNSASTDSVTKYISAILLGQQATTGQALGLTTLNATGYSEDSVIVVNNSPTLASVFTTVPDSFVVWDNSGSRSNSEIASGVTGLARSKGAASSRWSWAIKDNSRYAYINNSGAAFSQFTGQHIWTIYSRTFGHILQGTPLQPSGFTLTAISSDSMDADWTDNSASESGYSLFVYEPDSAWFSHLAASTTSDTIAPIWPPNTRVIADVAVVSGTDTVFSSSGRDTAWTLATVPPRVNQKLISDTELSFDINGFLFYDHFDDDDFSAQPVWTVGAGSFAVDTVAKTIRNTTGASLLSTPFADVSGDSIKDGRWELWWKFDSKNSGTAHSFVFWPIAHKSSVTDSSGYQLIVSYNPTIDSLLVQLDPANTSGASGTAIISQKRVVGEESLFKWHQAKLERLWTESPQDTTITWTVYVDGDSLSSGSETVSGAYFNTDFIGIETFTSDSIEFDGVQFQQIRPSANHDSTQYAVQDSVSGLYYQDAADSLKAGEDWRTFSQLTNGTAARDTLTQLQPDSLYQLRSKARNGWPSGN